MTTALPAASPAASDLLVDQRFSRALRDYVDSVATTLGVGPESCTVDAGVPASAYVALDATLPGYPDRDLALLWDERHGWSAAVETHSGEDLIVLGYLGGTTVMPPPGTVERFLERLQVRRGCPGDREPPALRPAGRHDGLAEELLRTARVPDFSLMSSTKSMAAH
jgi:hypothetical protein